MNARYARFTKLHVVIYERSNGRIGHKLGKQSALVLYTVGRKSGKRRSTTLAYYRDGGNYLVVASNWGKEIHPDWFYNLRQKPNASILVGAKTIEVVARVAEDDQYARLWQLVTQNNEQYIEYQKNTSRRIPIVILEPMNS